MSGWRPRPPFALSIRCVSLAERLGWPGHLPFKMHHSCAVAMGFDLLPDRSSGDPDTGASAFPLDERQKMGALCCSCEQPLRWECPWKVRTHRPRWFGWYVMR